MTPRLKLDNRPFKDRVIYGMGYKEPEALELSKDVTQCAMDVGALMQIQAFNILSTESGRFISRCNDIDYLNTWIDHYRSCKCPFLVVRENNIQIAIYKRRVVSEMQAVHWYRQKEELN